MFAEFGYFQKMYSFFVSSEDNSPLFVDSYAIASIIFLV